MSRAVVWSLRVSGVLEEIAQRIAQNNPTAAQSVVERIIKTAAQLGTRSIGRAGRVEGAYEKSVVGLPYSVCYTYLSGDEGEEKIVILHVIHTARQWPKGSSPR